MADVPPLTDDKECTTLRLFHVEHHQHPGECNCGDEWPCDVTRALARIEQDRKRIEELESVLRLHPAVSPDDPLLVTPAERQVEQDRVEIARLTADLALTTTHLDDIKELYRLALGRIRFDEDEHRYLTADLAACRDMLEIAWGVIANAGGGNWDNESAEWQGAAERWRDAYFAALARGEEK